MEPQPPIPAKLKEQIPPSAQATKQIPLPLIGAATPPPHGEPRPDDPSALEIVSAYHERTKHHYHRFAASLGYMDWATQPDPFRLRGSVAGSPPFPRDGAST